MVPTAEVQAQGTASLSYARHRPDLERRSETDTWYAGLGFLPGLEIGGRAIGGALRVGRNDLSADLKYRLPWLANPAVAVGVQDLGGTDVLLRRWYATSSLTWQTLELTAGIGNSRAVLDGPFGGLQWRPWSWLALMTEHDGAGANGGLELTTPAWHGWRGGMRAAWREAIDDVDYGAHVERALGRQYAFHEPPPTPALPGAGPALPAPVPPVPVPDAAALRERLTDLGFEAVQIGWRGADTQVVRLENRRYNHAAADGIGLALAVIAGAAGSAIERIELYLYVYGVPQLRVAVPAPLYRAFLEDPVTHAVALAAALEAHPVDGVEDAAPVQWSGAERAPLAGAEVVLEPLLRTFVATEEGLLDYGLGARARLTAPLGRGLLASVGAQVPLLRSDDFADDRPFAAAGPEAAFDLALLQYLQRPAPQWALLWSAGALRVFRVDFAAGALEQAWQSRDGRHLLRAKLIALHAPDRSREVALAGYGWLDPARAWGAALTAGRFYAGDAGLQVELTRWFADTSCTLFWRGASIDDQAVGLALALPLTPRRDARPGLLQVKGPRRWSHSLATTLNGAGARNVVRPLLLYEPTLDLDLRRDVLDGGRLGAAALREQLPRLHDAWTTFGGG